jgi:hypothetical protein
MRIKRLKLTGHRALQISVLPFGHETGRFQLLGHRARQLSRDPLGGSPVDLPAVAHLHYFDNFFGVIDRVDDPVAPLANPIFLSCRGEFLTTPRPRLTAKSSDSSR